MSNSRFALSRGKIAIFAIALLLLLSIIGFTVYISDYYRAEPSPQEQTSVHTYEQNGYLVIGNPDEAHTGYVFYPGGKVEAKAYIPYAASVVEMDSDIVCFIVKPLFHLAILSSNAADNPIEQHPSIESWAIGGHSLGGVVASTYVHSHLDRVDGLILLAAYPTEDMSNDDVSTLIITASHDSILNWEAFDEAQNLLPQNSQEVTISGGNHGQFGSYGEQQGDGEATISEAEQRAQVSSYTMDFLKSLT